MSFLNLILIIFLILLLLFIIVYVVDTVMAFITFEKVFRNFLLIEESSTDFSSGFFNYLTSQLKMTFHAKVSLMFFFNDGKISLGYYSGENGKLKDFKDYLNREKIYISKKNLEKLKNGKISKEVFYNIFCSRNLSKERVCKYHIIIPVVQEDNLMAFFLLMYPNMVSYFRGAKYFFFNSKRFKTILLDIILVARTRMQDVFSIIIDKLRDYAFITTDNGLNITTWNKGAEIMFGYKSDEVLYKNFRAFIFREFLEEFEKALEISLKKEETKVKVKILDFNNTLVTSEVLIRQIKIDELKLGYYLLVKDISKDEVLKENMRSKSLINRSIVENARDGIILLNTEDHIIYYNERLKNITDSFASFLGMDVSNVFPVKFSEGIKQKIRELKETNIDFNYLDIQIGEFWYNIRFFPIKNQEAGDYEGVIMFFIDNTLRMKTRCELEEKKALLEKMNESLIENLKSARMMQMRLIPKELPNNNKINFEAIYILSYQIGGDFYYAEELKLNGDLYYIAMVSDVSGHGVEASMLSVFVKDVYNEFKNTIKTASDFKPSIFLSKLNKSINNLKIEASKFITAFFIIIDLKKNRIIYSSAGHPGMVCIRNNKSIDFLSIKNSPPIGTTSNYTYKENITEIGKNDKIILYTDGLIDFFSSEKSYYGYFNNFLVENKKLNFTDFKDKISSKIKDSVNDKSVIWDDITVLLINIK